MRRARITLVFVVTMGLAACASKPPSRVHYVGPAFGPALAHNAAPTDGRLRLASLGAGDALGRNVHQNDVYLAYLAEVSAPLRVTGVADAP